MVKLDLFHAVQRITKTLSKRHPFHRQCLNELKLVFRQEHDLGKERAHPTPSSELMSKSLDNFVSKWNMCTSQGWKVLQDKSLRQVHNLKEHIHKDCLSDIPIGAGTNRNEGLHRLLNTHFRTCSRVGLPLALVLLTVLLYHHNCHIQEKITGHPCEPLLMTKDVALQNPMHTTTFGLISKGSQSSERERWLKFQQADAVSNNDYSFNTVILHYR